MKRHIAKIGTLVRIVKEKEDENPVYDPCEGMFIIHVNADEEIYMVSSEAGIMEVTFDEIRVVSKYYQPKWDQEDALMDFNGDPLWPFQVYQDRKICQSLFPGYKILTLTGKDVKHPVFMD